MQNERVRTIRKACDLTMEKFGERIGVAKTTISGIESGHRNLTEHMKKSICREFNVNYTWLESGEGEMFLDSDDEIMETIDRIMAGENEFHKNLFKTFARLDEEDLLALEHVINTFLDVSGKTKKSPHSEQSL